MLGFLAPWTAQGRRLRCRGGRATRPSKEVPMEERFETIEIKVAFLEKSLEELDDVVRGLSRELEQAHKEIKWLEDKLLSEEGGGVVPVERA